MKYRIILLTLVLFIGEGFGQGQQPACYTITDNKTHQIRIVSEADLKKEMEAFSQNALSNGAYYNEERYLVIPCDKEEQEISRSQEELNSKMNKTTNEDAPVYSWRQTWGNNNFGAENYIEIANSFSKESLNYSCDYGLRAMVLDNEIKIAELNSDCTVAVKENSTINLKGYTKITLFNKIVYEKSNSKLDYEIRKDDLSNIQYTKDFMVGCVPVTLKAIFNGMYGIKFTAFAYPDGIAASVKPYGQIDFSFEIASGISGTLGIGVVGSLHLISLELVSSTNFDLTALDKSTTLDKATTLLIRGKIDSNLKSLFGKLFFFVEMPFAKYKSTIADWNGSETSTKLKLWNYTKIFTL